MINYVSEAVPEALEAVPEALEAVPEVPEAVPEVPEAVPEVPEGTEKSRTGPPDCCQWFENQSPWSIQDVSVLIREWSMIQPLQTSYPK